MKITKIEYKGIQIKADNLLHEKLIEEFLSFKLDKDIKIAILGAGEGALDQRLIDLGYKNIVSVDINNHYKADNPNFIIMDLNKDFKDLGKFDVIFAIEIIEHLENQFHFIRNIYNILNKNGYLFLSIPNIFNKQVRVHFYLFGQILHFEKKDIYSSGHINPIFPHILEYNLNKHNLKILKKTYNRNYFKNDLYNSLKYSIYKFIVNILSFFIKGDKGVISIYIAKKVD